MLVDHYAALWSEVQEQVTENTEQLVFGSMDNPLTAGPGGPGGSQALVPTRQGFQGVPGGLD